MHIQRRRASTSPCQNIIHEYLPSLKRGGSVDTRWDHLHNELKVCRARRDITQGELAAAMDVSRQTIIAIEKGKYDPSLPLAFKLSIYFDTTIEELFQYSE